MKKLNRIILFPIAICFTTGAIAQKKTVTVKSKPVIKSETRISIDNNDSANGESEIDYRDEGGHKYHMYLKNDVVTDLTVDGKKIDEKDYPKYEGTIKKIKEQIRKDREQAEVDRKQAIKDQEEAEADRVEADKDREQAEADRREANEQREHAREDMRQAEDDRRQAQQDRKQAELDREEALKDRQQAEVDRKLAEEDRKVFKSIVADLISEKIISSEDKLFNLKLTDTELTVNGVKKSNTLHQKFKTKYLNGKHKQVMYYSNNRESGMSYQ
ncbi:MAG: hypothetical protein C5B52_07590 [Bacteroidetes bacterium]|nr:MAG: hypothetical protein C5B52_07590 [Bacteroidota bacterium]